MPLDEDQPQTTSRYGILTEQDVRFFHDTGYLGPFEAFSPEQMEVLREQIERDVLPIDGLAPSPVQSRHLDNRVVHDICACPAIVERVQSLFGPDIMLWRSNFFIKQTWGKEIPWHQDVNFWPIEPALNISAWMALDDVTTENSCVRIIPRSHKRAVRHVPAKPEHQFEEYADPTDFEGAEIVEMVLKPGQFFLFNEKVLHQSNPNTSDKCRMGLAIRMTVPLVRVDHEALFDGHTVLVVSGEDRMGFNRIGMPPK